MVKMGMLIAERYEILERIGTGGMSDVYKAIDHKLNRPVAVKVLKQEFAENENFVSKFRVEAQAAAGLMHQNIVNVYDVGEERGIHSIVFATTPFTFEGDNRQRTARGVMSMIEESANATFFIPLDKLVENADRFDDAMQRAVGTMASAVTMFWRLVEKPGYLKLDAERIRHLIAKAGRGRFAAATAQGQDRAAAIVDALTRAQLLATGSGPIRAIVCGMLAGDDLRLKEIDEISKGIRAAFGSQSPSFELATVNDEDTFSGRISVVLMLFEANAGNEAADNSGGVMSSRRRKKAGGLLSVGPQGRGRFNNAEPTIWNGEDLDIPTFLRRNISLDV